MGRFVPPRSFFIYRTMGMPNHAFLARRMQLTREIQKAAISNNVEREKQLRKQLADINKKISTKKKKK